MEMRGENVRPVMAAGLAAQGLDRHPITAPATPEAAEWQGWGSALKPAHEPIIVARKPLERGLTIAANVLKYGTGAINIDATRVSGAVPLSTHYASMGYGGSSVEFQSGGNPAGRWPSNLLLTHSPACEQVGEQQIGSGSRQSLKRTRAKSIFAVGKTAQFANSPDSYGTETVPDYACAPGCPVAELDRQSGNRPTGGSGTLHLNQWSAKGRAGIHTTTNSTIQPSEGGASRFFSTLNYEGADFCYTSKASTAEREDGLEDFGAQLVGDGRAKAMKLRDDLTAEERAFVLAELEHLGLPT